MCIRDSDNIIHVVEDVTKAEAVDPIADIEAIDYELILSDLEVVQNRAGRMAKACLLYTSCPQMLKRCSLSVRPLGTALAVS